MKKENILDVLLDIELATNNFRYELTQHTKKIDIENLKNDYLERIQDNINELK